jgi:nitroreductase
VDERLSIIFSRRSIRAYTADRVSEADIQSLLEAGMAAPSASNRKPWHFVVTTDRATLRVLADAHPYGKMLAGAALAIAVCGDPAISSWWVQDCTAATENILIAVSGLGLGAVWLGCHGNPQREQAVRNALGIPSQFGVLSLLSIGHPAEEKEARTQYDPTRIHRDRWRNAISCEALACQDEGIATCARNSLTWPMPASTIHQQDHLATARAAIEALRTGRAGIKDNLARAQLAGLGVGPMPARGDFLASLMLLARLAHPVPSMFCQTLLRQIRHSPTTRVLSLTNSLIP